MTNLEKLTNKIREIEPVGKYFIDLGINSTCLKCVKRYCTCPERQNGTWECNLLAKLLTS